MGLIHFWVSHQLFEEAFAWREFIWNWMWLFQPHLPLLAFGVDELGIFAKRCFDCGNMTSSWPKKCHFFPPARSLAREKTSWKTFAWVTCPWKSWNCCVCFLFYCFALRFVFSGGSSVSLTQLTICIREFVSFAGGWSGSRKFMIVSPIYLRTRWSSAVFWGFQNCLAKKIFTPLIQTGWAKMRSSGKS